MNTKLRKAVSLLLAFVIFISIPASSFAVIKESSKSNLREISHKITNITSKSNINILNGSLENLEHLEYTYEEDGNLYKVIENINSDLTHIESEVYIQKNNKEFEKVSDIITEFSDTDVSITTYENGEKLFETLPLKSFENIELATYTGSNVNLKQINPEDYSEVEISEIGTKSSKPEPGKWTYWGDIKYSTKIIEFTVGAVTALLSKTIGAVPVFIINYIVQEYIPNIWITDSMFYKYDEYGIRVEEMKVSQIYEDREV